MIDQLGYLAFEVSDLAAWEAFATNVLGLEVARRWDGGLSLAMDGHAQRFFLHQGPADDLAAIGWEVADEKTLDLVQGDFREATAAELAAREVVRMLVGRDPAGTQVEIYFGPAKREARDTRFVADALGLGHLVVSAPDGAAMGAFYAALGFRASDRITTTFYGHAVDIQFLHTNPRHHSLAYGGPQAKRLHHFLLEVKTIDDVGAALDRVMNAKVPVAQLLGRHPNDRMVSFYAFTPSGFQFEYGCGGRLISDEAAWQTTTYDRISEWGHHPPQRFKGPR